LNCGEKICCQFVVSGRDGPKVLNLVEEALDEIALAVEREIAVPLVLAAVRILIAPPSFLLLVAAGFLRTGSDAVDMTSVTPATDKNLRAAAIRDGLAIAGASPHQMIEDSDVMHFAVADEDKRRNVAAQIE
jgi:hypothetical protein